MEKEDEIHRDDFNLVLGMLAEIREKVDAISGLPWDEDDEEEEEEDFPDS